MEPGSGTEPVPGHGVPGSVTQTLPMSAPQLFASSVPLVKERTEVVSVARKVNVIDSQVISLIDCPIATPNW